MQPAPTEASQTATSVDQPPHTDSTSQYGLSDPAVSASSHLPRGEGRGSQQSLDDVEISSVSSSSTRRGRRTATRRVSDRDSSSQESSPGSRIQAYEKSNYYGRKRPQVMGFQIVSSSKTNKSLVAVDRFPNEVLTHILSHLPPETLSSMSLVSKRFHKLITTPHAWRVAFTRYFPGNDVDEYSYRKAEVESVEVARSERRAFTRLSALASWRSEYILRTRLLRSLGRGRPSVQALPRASSGRGAHTSAAAVVTYGAGLLYPVSHIHATFGIGLNKKQPLFLHGANEQGIVSASDPSAGKIGNWGLADFEMFKHFADLHIGEAEYGLGAGNVVGMSNVMDLSQPYGKIYGEACPGGRPFYTSVSEQRGRYMSIACTPDHQAGIPELNINQMSVCSVWMAKSERVLRSTNGLFGMLVGYSNGILAGHALGVNLTNERRFEKGEDTARWALCPGVPIVAIAIDEDFSAHRLSLRRVWAVVLNALGEVYYLDRVPVSQGKARIKLSLASTVAWQTGQSVEWHLIESTRRKARPDPFNIEPVDGSYSPRSSSEAAGLSPEQRAAETKEIEKFLVLKPKHYRHVCEGWNMRRKLIVDFAGDDLFRAGEAVFVLSTGVEDEAAASISRHTRRKVKMDPDRELDDFPVILPSTTPPSIFGGTPRQSDSPKVHTLQSAPRSRSSSADDLLDTRYEEYWQQSTFAFGDLRKIQITSIATDDSDYARIAAFEDPLLGMSGGSNTSSPLASPLGSRPSTFSIAEIPGGRARFMAVGTATGTVLLWNMRDASPTTTDIINTVQPLRAIYTKSPQISSVALTSLYLVHGGNDGLVQAWDLLASTSEAVRTLNSRFSDRARRRIAQAEGSAQGVGHNYYAAGAIALDPDPTVLRGMVSLGTHLRYWSYSASAADAYKSRKRGKLRRRSERGSNSAGNEQKYTHTGRGVLNDYIATERQDMERDKVAKQKENERLSGRYGTNLLGEDASEEDLLKYAMMVSEETFRNDQARHVAESSKEDAALKKAGAYLEKSHSADDDLDEAIRLSLLESEQASPASFTPQYDEADDFPVPIRYAKSSRHGTPSSASRAGSSRQYQGPTGGAGAVNEDTEDDLHFAMQLSLAEEQSKREVEEGAAKGKGRWE